jgi:hypothetical protein
MAGAGPPDNADEIDKARRRLARRRGWYIGWLLTLLLAPAAAVGAGMALGKGGHNIVIGIAAGVIDIVALICLCVMVSRASSARRQYEMAVEADRLGHEYIDEPVLGKLRFLEQFQALSGGRAHKARGLIRGEVKGRQFLALGFTFTRGGGEEALSVSQTLIVMIDAGRAVPGMSMTPRGFWEAAGLPVRGQEELNRRYVLASQDFEGAPRCISAELADLCLEEGGVAFEARDDLLVYWPGTLLRAYRLAGSLRTAAEIARLLAGGR